MPTAEVKEQDTAPVSTAENKEPTAGSEPHEQKQPVQEPKVEPKKEPSTAPATDEKNQAPKRFELTKEELTKMIKEEVRNKQQEIERLSKEKEDVSARMHKLETQNKFSRWSTAGLPKEQFEILESKIEVDELGNDNIAQLKEKYKLAPVVAPALVAQPETTSLATEPKKTGDAVDVFQRKIPKALYQ